MPSVFIAYSAFFTIDIVRSEGFRTRKGLFADVLDGGGVGYGRNGNRFLFIRLWCREGYDVLSRG